MAQQRRAVVRIGSLSVASKPDSRIETFESALKELGWFKGSNLLIEYRWAAGHNDRLLALAQELLQLKLDLIVARGTPTVHALRHDKTVPIVMSSVADPEGSGFVNTLARPGGNVTGTSLMGPELAGKRLELMKEILPALKDLSFLGHEDDPAHKLFYAQTRAAARKLGIQVHLETIRKADEIDAVFSRSTKTRTQALITQPIVITSFGLGPEIARLALKHRVPTISDGFQFADVGGLMYYGPDRNAIERRTAAYVDKILRGSKPAELPVEQPTTFEVVINKKTAQVLGLTIPQTVMLRADRVIE